MADSVVTWMVLLFVGIYFFCLFVKKAIEEEEQKKAAYEWELDQEIQKRNYKRRF